MLKNAPLVGVACLLLAAWPKAKAGEAVRLYDFGADEMAYLALPSEAPKASILLIPDAMGAPEVVAARCELLAKLGYIALALDFYGGQTAKDRSQVQAIQRRVSPDVAEKTIAAALKMLVESPQYRTGKIVVAVWGANMEFFRPRWSGARIPLVALSWMEPEGPVDPDPFAGLPRPLQVLANNGPWLKEWEKAQMAGALKKIPADIHFHNAKPGFLLQSSLDEQATQAWVSIIEFWKAAAERESAVPETSAPVEVPKPQNPVKPKSEILPRRVGR